MKLDQNYYKSDIFAICSASVQQTSTSFYLKHMRMSYVSMPIFVNFGLLSTKWEFLKLRRCLRRLHGKCPLYARVFRLSCYRLKYLYSAGRPSRDTSVQHLVVFITAQTRHWNYKMSSIFVSLKRGLGGLVGARRLLLYCARFTDVSRTITFPDRRFPDKLY